MRAERLFKVVNNKEAKALFYGDRIVLEMEYLGNRPAINTHEVEKGLARLKDAGYLMVDSHNFDNFRVDEIKGEVFPVDFDNVVSLELSRSNSFASQALSQYLIKERALMQRNRQKPWWKRVFN